MKLKKNCKIRDVAGEKIVVLQGREGMDLTKVIMLNDTAEFLWNSLTGSEFIHDDVVGLIVENFNVPPERASNDATIWIASLERAGLLE